MSTLAFSYCSNSNDDSSSDCSNSNNDIPIIQHPYKFKTYPIDRNSTNGVFHIYLPKTFFQFLRKTLKKTTTFFSKDSKSSSLELEETRKFFLEGQIGTGPASTSAKSSDTVTICSISGIRVFSGTDSDSDKKNGPQTSKTFNRRKSSRLDTRNQIKTLNENPNIIGELLIGEAIPSQRPEKKSRFWMILELHETEIGMYVTKKDIYFPVGLRSVQMPNDKIVRNPGAENVIWMYYNPKEVKYVQFQRIQNSGIPEVVLDVFRQDIPYPVELENKSGWERIELIRGKVYFEQFRRKFSNRNQNSLVPFNKSEYLGGYDGDYFERTGERNFLKIRSAGMEQLLYKLYLFKGIVTGKYGLDLCLLNLLTILVLDFIMGYYFTRYLLKFPSLYSILHSKIGDLLEALLQLLNWLRGSPAGLKLNAELNSLLWRFFSYHLHLWRNYIGILEPVLSTLLSTVIHAGVLGLTLQISLIQDLLSMATFHVYCLYIYASRLFSVQQIMVKSLGRLFMGRKWNPLRGRIDHVRLSKLEMFLGALAFTIGIFLVPTTLVYYCVFLSLRLPVLIIESVLSYFVSILNTCRLITTFLIVTNSPRVCDEIFLDPILENSDLNDVRDEEPKSVRFLIRVQNTKSIWRFPNLGPIISKLLKDIIQGTVLN